MRSYIDVTNPSSTYGEVYHDDDSVVYVKPEDAAGHRLFYRSSDIPVNSTAPIPVIEIMDDDEREHRIHGMALESDDEIVSPTSVDVPCNDTFVEAIEDASAKTNEQPGPSTEKVRPDIRSYKDIEREKSEREVLFDMLTGYSVIR